MIAGDRASGFVHLAVCVLIRRLSSFCPAAPPLRGGMGGSPERSVGLKVVPRRGNRVAIWGTSLRSSDLKLTPQASPALGWSAGACAVPSGAHKRISFTWCSRAQLRPGQCPASCDTRPPRVGGPLPGIVSPREGGYGGYKIPVNRLFFRWVTCRLAAVAAVRGSLREHRVFCRFTRV